MIAGPEEVMKQPVERRVASHIQGAAKGKGRVGYNRIARALLGSRWGFRVADFAYRSFSDDKLRTEELIQQFDMFAGLGGAETRALARLFHPRLVVPDEVIIRKGERGDAMFLISSGAVEVVRPRDRVRLGSGDFFGLEAFLGGQVGAGQPQVVARSYCRVLVLSAADFRRFLMEYPQAKVEIVAEARTRSKEGLTSPPPGPVVVTNSVPGSILWNPPDRMRVGHRERVEVRVADAEMALEALGDGLRGRGVPQLDKLEVAPLMRVALTADPADFFIQALSTQDQLVRLAVVARWDFDVLPLRGGLQRLRLLASMRVKVEGKDEIVDLPSYEAEVRVIVAPMRAVGQFCARNWQWIAGTVIVPLFAYAASTTSFGSAALKQIRAWLNP
jgi:CRP-like cAMP-binding protein